MDKPNYEFIKDKDDELGIGEHKWYGREEQTESNLLHDKGVGEPIVIRNFEFARTPGSDKPTKEQILTAEYVKHLQTLLWADSLRMVLEPRVNITDDKIIISVPCQARTGATIMETPKYLQELI